jgi:hypothetical protein
VKKNHLRLGIAIAAVILLGIAQNTWAQSPRVIHGDATGTIGWLAVDTHSTGPYDRNDWVDSFFGAVSAGWHWTDNLKTEIDFGGSTDSRVFRTQPVTIAGRSTLQTIQSRFKQQTLGFSQQYQFFHNVWFHPHVAAGVNLTWTRQRDEPGQIYFYDPVTGTSRLEPRSAGTQRTSLRANPLIAVGYKAYLSDRAFFRNDLRVAFNGGPTDTVLRLGFGFDF